MDEPYPKRFLSHTIPLRWIGIARYPSEYLRQRQGCSNNFFWKRKGLIFAAWRPKKNPMKPAAKPVLHLYLVIPLVIFLFTVLLWERYIISDISFNRLMASRLILVLGALFSVAVGFFIWSMEKNLAYQKHLFRTQQFETVGRLASAITHDFNNLLAVVSAYSQYLMEDLAPSDPRRKEAENIQELIARGSKLTRQLLALSGQHPVKPEIVDLNRLILNMDTLFQKFLGKTITLTVLPGEGLGQVKADPHQLEQVLLNLLVNARDAMPKGGKLEIQTSNADMATAAARGHGDVKPGQYVLCTMRDTGCGMSEDVQAHIFEPFFTTKGKEKGTGLGLATAYGVIQQAGGAILVTSELNRGTTFRIYLPRIPK